MAEKEGIWERIFKREVHPEEKKTLDRIMTTMGKLTYDIYMYPFINRRRLGPDIDRLMFQLDMEIDEWKKVRAKIKKEKEIV